MIEAHGGKIWIESDGENLGSRFIFTLPVRDTAPDAKAAIERIAKEEGNA